MKNITKIILRFSSMFALMVMVLFGGFVAKLWHPSSEEDKKDGDGNKSAGDFLYSNFAVGTAHADAPPAPGDGPDPCPGPGDPGC